MLSIVQSPDFSARVPHFLGVAIEAHVLNSPTSPALWEEMLQAGKTIVARYTTDTIKDHPGITATRTAYKACGKDPSRYRPASEQLARRILQGKSLYSVDTLVDLGNLVSIAAGYPTGLLDADRIEGEQLTLGIGRAEEPYEGIGRGPLNVEGLPLYRDACGGVASPTSDSTRTMLSASTTHLLFIINGYDGYRPRMEHALAHALDLLRRYADCREEHIVWF